MSGSGEKNASVQHPIHESDWIVKEQINSNDLDGTFCGQFQARTKRTAVEHLDQQSEKGCHKDISCASLQKGRGCFDGALHRTCIFS